MDGTWTFHVTDAAIFNTEKLEWINAQHLKRLDEAERVRRVGEFLTARGHDLSGHDAPWLTSFVRALGDRLKTLTERGAA